MDETDRINRAAQLGGLAYLVELEIRLHAQRTPGLDKFTHSNSPALESEFLTPGSGTPVVVQFEK